MRDQLQWLALVAGFCALVAGSLGCATMLVSDATDTHDYTPTPVLTDEIIAIGQPDASLSKKLGQPDVIAFIGKKNTYMLYQGGKELAAIAGLQLDGRHMNIDADSSRNLFIKDQKVWGQLVLQYGEDMEVSTDERAKLKDAGFTQIDQTEVYSRTVDIEGVVYPAISLTDAQMEKLTTQRKISLYDPNDNSPPLNLSKLLLIPAIAVDIVLTPVYLFAGLVILVSN